MLSKVLLQCTLLTDNAMADNYQLTAADLTDILSMNLCVLGNHSKNMQQTGIDCNHILLLQGSLQCKTKINACSKIVNSNILPLLSNPWESSHFFPSFSSPPLLTITDEWAFDTAILYYTWMKIAVDCYLCISYSSGSVKFQSATYNVTEGANDTIDVTLEAVLISTCLRSFTVYVSSQDGSAHSECQAVQFVVHMSKSIQYQCSLLNIFLCLATTANK